MVVSGCECTVCQETYKLGEKVVKLPCGHCFHQECVQPWFDHHDNCPVCRKSLPANLESLEEWLRSANTDAAATDMSASDSLNALD
jgi:hypothetical protein